MKIIDNFYENADVNLKKNSIFCEIKKKSLAEGLVLPYIHRNLPCVEGASWPGWYRVPRKAP